ncbi:MAG: hypothetical protein ACR2NA_06660 [Solirubrobacterales bacterium]
MARDARQVIALALLAMVHLGLGGVMVFAPGTFFEHIGAYGVQNDHYIRDLGAVYLAYGAASLLAMGWHGWRAALFGLGALWYGLHAVNHIVDVGEASSTTSGVTDAVLISVGALVLAWLARDAREPSWGSAAR